MLELVNINKIFNRGTVNESQLFCNFSIKIEKGEFVSVIGSNGSGKTTMLNIISGSIPNDSGSVILDGENITKLPEYKRARKIGRVYQNPAVGTVGNMTIFENLAIAESKGKKCLFTPAIDRKKSDYYRELVYQLGLGLEDKMNIPVELLSGGQRQALSLLMSTMTPIDLLLLDEHTAALDPKTSETIMQLTDKIVKEKGITTLMVTHNLRYAVEYGNRIVMMHKGETVIDERGEAKERICVDDLLGTFNSISIECGN
ncbi:MAG: ATP-binding cassette domain-containing protein [Clostridia bacterium]|nr:ATP-binding cassette domain-containing protein [Clostridia bacterium]